MTIHEKRDIWLSNYGRWYGWRIYRGEQHVCDFCYHSAGDMFWEQYVIHNSFDETVYDDRFWDDQFTAVSRISSSLTVVGFICRWDDSRQLVHARALYLKEKISFIDRLRIMLDMPTGSSL